MTSSSSKVPAIVLGAIIIAVLVAFYIADRSSPGMSSAERGASEREDMHKPSGPHSGYSGSLKEYLKKY